MSRSYPIISITGSSGAGTTSVKKTFENIFRREKVAAAYIEGDAFHRYNRADMRTKMAEEAERGNKHFSHFSPETNLFEAPEKLFRDYGESGTGTTRHYVHDDQEAKLYGADPGTFTEWAALPEKSDLLFYEGLHGAVVTDKVNIAQHADLKIGVVPVINLEWIQKLHRDRSDRGYTADLRGKVAGHGVYVVGQVFPGSGYAFDHRLPAQLSFRSYFARHTRYFRAK